MRDMITLASVTDPSAIEIASFLAVLFFLLAGYNQLMKAVDRWTEKKKEFKGEVRLENDPLHVKMAEEFARREECQQRHQVSIERVERVEAEMAEIRKQRIVDAKDAGAGREKMYNAIKEVRRELTDHIEKVRSELSDKTDQVPDRVIAMLRNFGFIGKVN